MKKKKLKEKIKALQRELGWAVSQNATQQKCYDDLEADWLTLVDKKSDLKRAYDELENRLFDAEQVAATLKEIRELIASNLPAKKVTLDSIHPAPIAPLVVTELMLPRYDEIVPKEQRSPEEERILCEQEHATVLPREMG